MPKKMKKWKMVVMILHRDLSLLADALVKVSDELEAMRRAK